MERIDVAEDLMKLQRNILNGGKQWLYDREKRHCEMIDGEIYISDFEGMLFLCEYSEKRKVNLASFHEKLSKIPGYWRHLRPIYWLSRWMKRDVDTVWNGIFPVYPEDFE